MTPEQKIEKLEAQVAELMMWKQVRSQQQLSFPLDPASAEILNKNSLRFNRAVYFTRPSGQEILDSLIFETNGKRIFVSAGYEYMSYTYNLTSNVITADINIQNNYVVDFFSTQIIPTGLAVGPYYVVNSSGNTFQVSTTSGGVAVDITADGAGEHYFYFV